MGVVAVQSKQRLVGLHSAVERQTAACKLNPNGQAYTIQAVARTFKLYSLYVLRAFDLNETLWWSRRRFKCHHGKCLESLFMRQKVQYHSHREGDTLLGNLGVPRHFPGENLVPGVVGTNLLRLLLLF